MFNQRFYISTSCNGNFLCRKCNGGDLKLAPLTFSGSLGTLECKDCKDKEKEEEVENWLEKVDKDLE